jgi:PPK2 family polyphosphate:nucleotide phosphotransferase
VKVRTRLRAGPGLALRDEDAGATPLRDSGGKHPRSKEQIKAHERALTDALTAKIALHQQMLFSQRKQKVLLVLQGMDTSGKDGTVRALFSRINPMGLHAAQFKAPSLDEAAHDFLWRIHPHVPGAGEIAIFNRSHYEDVLVPRVQHLIDEKQCQRRYGHIADFERMLADSGTVIVKLFLHISKDEQRRRLQARLDDPKKQWKFDENDLLQRKRWDDYRDAYERAIAATDAAHAPWYVIPADSKTHRNLLVATLLLEVMEALALDFPKTDARLSALKVE